MAEEVRQRHRLKYYNESLIFRVENGTQEIYSDSKGFAMIACQAKKFKKSTLARLVASR